MGEAIKHEGEAPGIVKFLSQDMVKKPEKALFPASILLYENVVGSDTAHAKVKMTKEFYSKYLHKDICKSKFMAYRLVEKNQANKFQKRMPSVIQVFVCLFLSLRKNKATIYVNMNMLRKRFGRICSKLFTVVILKNNSLRDLGRGDSLFTLHFLHFCMVTVFQQACAAFIICFKVDYKKCGS